ncbi:MAG: Rrf2 family transcriptional regulator [Deltaproteobacteria bacterium]|nr:Rrf2 family transcriptional regulator [Deltaproteobacteria bacterium]
MRLTSQVRYAVLAVLDMAYHETGAPHQAKTISSRQEIPPRYLEQIFQRLVRGGILRSKRGPRGGYTLSRPPARVTIGDIVRATEGSVEALVGGSNGGPPRGAAAGPARGNEEIWGVVVARVADALESLTIEELVHVAERLGIEREAAGNMYFI